MMGKDAAAKATEALAEQVSKLVGMGCKWEWMRYSPSITEPEVVFQVTLSCRVALTDQALRAEPQGDIAARMRWLFADEMRRTLAKALQP
jgi:hypothetical protein